MVVGFTTTYAISAYQHSRCEFESRSDEVNLKQHYVIKFVSDLHEVGGFLSVLRFPSPIKMTATIEILLKVALNTITLICLLSCVSSINQRVMIQKNGTNTFIHMIHLSNIFSGQIPNCNTVRSQ